MAKLKAGDRSPDFTLVDQGNKKVSLKSFRGKHVVVYFYPKADTPGCTTQSCAVRDAIPDLKKLKAVAVGISRDPPAKQKKFDDKYDLGFPLLGDEDHKVAKAWGVWGKKKLYGREFMGIIRSAFVVDPKGKIVDAFYKVSTNLELPHHSVGNLATPIDACLARQARSRTGNLYEYSG